MRMFKPKRNKITLTEHQMMAIRAGRTTKKKLKREIGMKQLQAYSVAKLKSSGLWDHKQNKTKLTVRRISDLSPEERREMGLD